MTIDDIRNDLGERKDRIAALSLLASGRVPSWYLRNKPNSQASQEHKDRLDDETISPSDSSTYLQLKSSRIAILLFLLASVVKIMLFPTYRSTDFLVHRHWKALTLHAPRQTWYYDDISMHTLDYPPLFALFESFWSNVVFPMWVRLGLVEETCLSLLPDAQIVVDGSCVRFMRSTVVLSDIVWGYAAWIVSRQDLIQYSTLLFHPALFFLDHIHFQYNGFLLGILLLAIHAVQAKRDCLAAALIGALISLKHIYVTCCLWFLVVWCKRYSKDPKRLIFIGVAGAAPIAMAIACTIDMKSPKEWGIQVLRRLFPFHRGLLHDYWAGNVWAFYAAADKVLAKTTKLRLPLDFPPLATIVATLLLQAPALIRVNEKTIWSSFTMMALASFLTQYHGHEKAILTALMPAIVDQNADLSFQAAAIVSLFPLLFENNELSFKVASAVLFLGWVEMWRNDNVEQGNRRVILARYFLLLLLFLAVLQLEFVPTFGKYEFLKLIVVSVSCGLVFVLEYFSRFASVFQRDD